VDLSAPRRRPPRLAAPALAGLAVAAGAILGAGTSPAAEGERSPMVRVATSGNDSERVETLRITREAGARKRSVISLGPHALPDLARGDRVRVTAELQVTTNCRTPGPRCRGSIYQYGPKVRARLVLASGKQATDGPSTMPIGKLKHETCTQKRPQYEHHCVLVFTQDGFEIGDPSRLPCALDDCHINLVADVHHPRASAGDLLMVGGQRPTGKIPQDRGRINAVRYRDVLPSEFRTTATQRLHRGSLPPDFRRRVVISKRVRGLERKEQLAVSALMRTDISHLPYAVRTSAYLILAESRRATRPGEFVKSHVVRFGEISENNGSNCTKPPGTCTYRKVGVLEMRRDAGRHRGRPRPLYVNLVTVLGPKVLDARAGDRVRLPRGSIEVTRFPPGVHG